MPTRPPNLRPPPLRKAWSQRSSAAHARIRGRKGVTLREQVRREEPLCRACLAEGRVSATSEVDHISPLAEGGTNDRINLQGLCADHHKVKSEAERLRAARRDPWGA